MKEKLVSWKVSQADVDWARAEQLRLRRVDRKFITQADLFRRMVLVYRLREPGAAQVEAPAEPPKAKSEEQKSGRKAKSKR